MCVWLCFAPFTRETSTVSSFIHSQPHFLFFQRGFHLEQNNPNTQKKVENNRKPTSAVSNQHPFAIFAAHVPYISLLSSFLRPCLVVHPLHLLHGTTYLSDHVILQMRPDLTVVAFRITRHTWKRLPASMLTLVSQHRW